MFFFQTIKRALIQILKVTFCFLTITNVGVCRRFALPRFQNYYYMAQSIYSTAICDTVRKINFPQHQGQIIWLHICLGTFACIQTDNLLNSIICLFFFANAILIAYFVEKSCENFQNRKPWYEVVIKTAAEHML